MNKNLALICLTSLLLLPVISSAQSADMADVMREDGKIYVVVGVIFLIFCVLFLYLIQIDLKLRKLEKGTTEK
jgi:Ca2+/Na+ antiporter